MIRLGRALRSLLFAGVSGPALLSRRAVVFSSREITAQQLRKPLATGGVVLCSRKLGVAVNIMADSESKGAPELPAAGSEGERAGEEGVGPSKKNDEGKKESGLVSTSPEGEKEEKEEGGPDEATNGTDSNENNKMDDVEMAAEPSKEADRTIISEDKSKTDAKMTTATLAKDETRNGVDKTPPPEEIDESTMTREDTSQTKDDKHQAGTHPQKQGGFGSFFTSPVASMRRWFSQEPKRDRQYYENLTLEEKRKLYKCGRDFVTLDGIPTWEEYRKKKPLKKQPECSSYPPNTDLNKKVSLWQGDITKLEIDAIVNAANSSLLGGGGVDGAIHRAAGYSLKDECATLGGCDTGDAKLTSGHRLPAKYVLHTVGPINCSGSKLRSCYQHCLQLTLENGIRSVAFSCIATGVYGFPNKDAAKIALETTREWLETNADKVDRVIFCVFLKVDLDIYSNLLHRYFPADETDTDLDSNSKGPVVVVEGSPADQPHPPSDKPLPSAGEREDTPTVPSPKRCLTEPVSTTVEGTSASASNSTVKSGHSATAEPSNTLESEEGTEKTADDEEEEAMEVSDSCTSPTKKKPKTE